MIEKATSAASIASMLRTLEAHSAQAKGLSDDSASGVPKTNFAEVIGKAVSQTNAAQVDSQKTTSAFESGEAVPLTEVVMKMQKASLSFEATLQVRNKVLKAYEDVMNMPV